MRPFIGSRRGIKGQREAEQSSWDPRGKKSDGPPTPIPPPAALKGPAVWLHVDEQTAVFLFGASDWMSPQFIHPRGRIHFL